MNLGIVFKGCTHPVDQRGQSESGIRTSTSDNNVGIQFEGSDDTTSTGMLIDIDNDIWTSDLIMNFWVWPKRGVLPTAYQHRKLVFEP